MTETQPDTHLEPALVESLKAEHNGAFTHAVRYPKIPVGKSWQNTKRTLDQIKADHGGPNPSYTAYGVKTGAISGGLELIELEGPHAHRIEELEEHFTDQGRTDLWNRLNECTALSPSGGIHFIIRTDWDGKQTRR